MSVSASGQGPREKSRTPKTKANTDAPSAATVSNPQNSSSAAPVTGDASADAMDDASKNILDGKSAPRFVCFFLLAFSFKGFFFLVFCVGKDHAGDSMKLYCQL